MSKYVGVVGEFDFKVKVKAGEDDLRFDPSDCAKEPQNV